MSNFPLPRIVDFLKGVVPFEALEPGELNRLVHTMEIAYFPPGQEVISQNGDSDLHLHIIHSGSVKLTTRTESGKEILVDVRGEGETFGALGLLQGGKNKLSVITREDLLTFLLPGDEFRGLLERHPEFIYHFNLPLVNGLEGVAPDVCHQMTGLQGMGALALDMRGLVSEIMSKQVLFCDQDTPIREAARLMSQRGVGSIVVRDEKGQPLGMVTDTDLRSRVVAAGLDPSLPVSRVMSSPLKTLSPRAYTFEALMEMTRQRVHHLVVTEGERLVGVVSDHDISVGAGSSPVGLVRQVDKAGSFQEVVNLSRRVFRVLHMLLRLAVSAEFITDFLTEFQDRLNQRLVQIVIQQMEEEGLGGAPCAFGWLAFGSPGRREPILPPRQEYFLVHENVTPDREETVQEWFGRFCQRLRQGLTRCSFAQAPLPELPQSAGIPRSLAQLKAAFRNWIREPTPKLMVRVGPFFDFRPVYQEQDFSASLREAIYHEVERNRRFLRILARAGFEQPPPLGFLREFVVEKDGEYKDWLDLQERVVQPVVNGARVLALDQKIPGTGTPVRLEGAVRLGIIDPALVRALCEALDSITFFQLGRFLEAQAADAQPEPLVEPASLNKVQRKMFKKGFAAVAEFQEKMMQRYGTGIRAG